MTSCLKKSDYEREVNSIRKAIELKPDEKTKKESKAKLDITYTEIDKINNKISDLINIYNNYFNPYWGQMMRAGSEESNFAEQVEKICLYLHDKDN